VSAQLVASTDTLRELIEKLLLPKFDRYVRRERREVLLQRVASLVEIIEVLQPIRASRDPKDDKFLEAAVSGRAHLIVTGDRDLLDLHPFRDVHYDSRRLSGSRNVVDLLTLERAPIPIAGRACPRSERVPHTLSLRTTTFGFVPCCFS
jgi:putative PIN family toxin of toxin-antitoxin system